MSLDVPDALRTIFSVTEPAPSPTFTPPALNW
jgi:hypothetical protein